MSTYPPSRRSPSRCPEVQRARKKENVAAWQAKNKGKLKEYASRHRRKYRERYNAKVREWTANNPERMKRLKVANNLKANYGLSIEEYEAMVESQGGVCAICGNPPGKRRLNVDHDHETGIIRALLCGHCNRGIGYFREDVEVMAKAIEYVRRFG